MTTVFPVYAVDELFRAVTDGWSRDQTESVATPRNRWLTTMQTVDAPFGSKSKRERNTASDALVAILWVLETMGPGGEHPQFAGLSATEILGSEWGKNPVQEISMLSDI
jgi:hypothetical protein